MINKFKRVVAKMIARLRMGSEIRRLRSCQNTTLNHILDAIDKVRAGKYTQKDREVFRSIAAYRSELLRSERMISYAVFGSDEKRMTSEICRTSASPPRWGELHYFLVKELKSRSYLEIGTNLGISGSYLLAALQQNHGKLFTMEGQPDLCAIASARFESMAGEKSFEVIEGLYDKTFPELLTRPVLFDTVFIDGNHKRDPTLQYFSALKQKIVDPAVIIFDDIRWSEGMREAWEIIKKDPDVNYCIDLRKLGIVVIDKKDAHRNIVAGFLYKM